MREIEARLLIARDARVLQVALYSSAAVTICEWGGISMLNWLMPDGAAEIILTAWRFSKQLWPRENSTTEPCPDWEAGVRDNIPWVSTLRYCDATAKAKHSEPRLNVSTFMPLLEHAVASLRASKSLGF